MTTKPKPSEGRYGPGRCTICSAKEGTPGLTLRPWGEAEVMCSYDYWRYTGKPYQEQPVYRDEAGLR